MRVWGAIVVLLSGFPKQLAADGVPSMGVRNAEFQRGNAAFHRGDLEGAMRSWRWADSPPGSDGTSFHGPALANIAFVQFSILGNRQAGLREYYRAVYFEPTNLDIRVNLGGVLAQLGNFSEAMAALLGSSAQACRIGSEEHKRASTEQLSTCVQLYTNIASALKQEPRLQRKYAINTEASPQSFIHHNARPAPFPGHEKYLRTALDFAAMAVSREPAVKLRKCTVRIDRLSRLRQDPGNSSPPRTGLVSRDIQQQYHAGLQYGEPGPYNTIAASPYLRNFGATKLDYLAASAYLQHQTMFYMDRRIFLANFSRVVLASPTVEDGEPLIIDPSRCVVYARYDDELPSAWWRREQRAWLRDAVVRPFDGRRDRNNSSSETLLHQRPQCDAYFDRAATPTQRWTGNYFHWLTEVCSRLVGLLESDALKGDEQLPLIVPDFAYRSDERPRFIAESLELLLGLSRSDVPNASNVVYMAEGRPVYQHPPSGGFRYCFKNLLTLDWAPAEGDRRPGLDPNPPRALLYRVRERLLAGAFNRRHEAANESWGASSSPKRVVYVSRAGVSSRTIVNEVALVRALNQTFRASASAPAGMEFVVFGPNDDSSYDLRKTIDIFSGAAVVVGVHGAGLTNMLFMPPGSRVLELALPEPCFRDYMHLAAAMNHVYAAMVLPPKTYNSAVAVDVDEASAHFAALLSADDEKRTQKFGDF